GTRHIMERWPNQEADQSDRKDERRDGLLSRRAKRVRRGVDERAVQNEASLRRDDFEQAYAERSGVSVEFLRSVGRVPFYCSGCDDYDFPHWEMGRMSDDAFDRRHEIKPPA